MTYGEQLALPFEAELLQEPHRWCWQHNVTVLDPDGWGDKDWLTPVTEKEFLARLALSTCIFHRPDTNGDK